MNKNLLGHSIRFYVSFLLIFLLQLIYCAGFAQTNGNFIDKAIEGLNKRAALLPIEKAYLQFDKPYYVAGDVMWFRGYVTIGAFHKLTAKSGILNVELINSRNQVKQSFKLELEKGMCSGDIALPDTIEAGVYRVRAYTNWMRNQGNAYYFERNFAIDNAITNSLTVKASYTYQLVNNVKQTTATIHFANLKDSLYAQKEVRYAVFKNGRGISFGRGVTDASGNLKINFKDQDGTPGQSSIEISLLTGRRNIKRIINVQPEAAKISVQFFPEGGNMVQGLPSVVGFKAIGADGLGKNVSGVIIDNEGQEVAQLEARHFGMGSFILTPQSGKTYKARFKMPNGSETVFNLPAAQDKGYVMRLFNEDSTQVVISVFGNYAADVTGILHLIAQTNAQVCFAASIKINGTRPVFIKIPKERFPGGIAQFTLFSASGEPLLERVAFINNKNNLLNLQVITDKQIYRQREEVEVALRVIDSDKLPVTGSFSAAVINETALNAGDSKSSILSALLLTSDLKGYIEEPGYYFVSPNEKTQADLDLLMLTQGYRKFEWKKILNGNMEPPVYEAQQSITFAGTLKTPSGKPVAGGKVRLLTTNGPPVIIDTLSDANGRFAFHNLQFKDSTRFILQANTGAGKSNIVVELDTTNLNGDKSFSYQVSALADTVPVAYLNNSQSRYRQDLALGIGNHNILLQEVVIKDKKTVLKNSSNLNGPGQANYIIDGKTIRNMACPTIASCLSGRLPGVVFDEFGNPRSVRSINIHGQKGALLVIIDGVKMTAGGGNTVTPNNNVIPNDPFDSINASDISSVELLTDPSLLAIYGFEGGNGVLIINTLKGGEALDEIVRATNTLPLNPKGYYLAKEFYSPDYSVANDAKKADLRTTISWKPELLTGKDGKISFSYYNADGTGTYRIIIEGIDSNGNLGRCIYRYKVE